MSFMDLTPNFIKNNFDRFVGTEIEIEVEGNSQHIMLHKDIDDNGSPVDYINSDGTYFMYTVNSSAAAQPLGFIDLTDYNPGDIKINISNPQSGSGRKRQKRKSRKKRGGFRHGQLVEIKWGNIDGGFDWWKAWIIADNGGSTIKVWWLGLETPDGFPLHEVIPRPRPGDIRILQGKTKGGRTKSRKMKGGHHLYKRLGVSKYASQKQIRKAYNKLKKKKRVTSKIKHAYNILSKKKSRRKYNLRYKTRKH